MACYNQIANTHYIYMLKGEKCKEKYMWIQVKKGCDVMGGIVAAAITAVCSLIGVIITNIFSNRKIEHSLQTSQAVTDYKIEELTREVREHNNFAKRMPVVEEQIKVINHRIEDLERKG